MRARNATLVAGLLLLTLISSLAWATPAAEPTSMVKTMGWHRTRDSAIWVWRGNKSCFRTLTHELLHRATHEVPRLAWQDMARLTSDPQFMEGLTAYFTGRALELTHKQPTYSDPRGSTFGDLRRWSRDIRADARDTLHAAFGVEIDTRKITICNDKTFGRCHLRDFGEPWVSHPGQPGTYGNSKSRVQQIVDLVGEGPVRRAYFEGDAAGLRAALAQARRQSPTTFPAWISL